MKVFILALFKLSFSKEGDVLQCQIIIIYMFDNLPSHELQYVIIMYKSVIAELSVDHCHHNV